MTDYGNTLVSYDWLISYNVTLYCLSSLGDSLSDWLPDRHTHLSEVTEWLTVWLTDWLTDTLTRSLTFNSMTDRLINYDEKISFAYPSLF